MRVRCRVVVAWVCALVVGGGAAAAQPGTAEADAEASCAEVTVNGVRAPSFECLTHKLQPRPQLPPQGPGDAQPGLASEAIVLRPSNQLGLFNRAATSTRMGNTFGTSVYPQRPPQVQFALPPGTR
ncbi:MULTISPECIES: hypothetical protein [unclassified Variovorax]|uniref:hypothetical protein n=1 Tax=unclassified Variovorax TaxID=663243 RepID=UPI003F452336